MAGKIRERRHSVRVTDRIMFGYEVVESERFEEIEEDFLRGISFYNSSGLADIQMYVGAQGALARLQEKDPELGLFLQHLDTKLNIVLQKVTGDASPFDAMSLLEVNFSASGLAVYLNDPIVEGTLLGLHITLLPNYYYIYCFGRVVSLREELLEEEETKYRVAIKFILIGEDDKEALIQHNFRQQSLALRNRRLENSC